MVIEVLSPFEGLLRTTRLMVPKLRTTRGRLRVSS